MELGGILSRPAMDHIAALLLGWSRMRLGHLWWAHLKDHQFHRCLPLVGSADDGVDRLNRCLPSLGVNRLSILSFHGQRALHHVDNRRRGMGVPLPNCARLDGGGPNPHLKLLLGWQRRGDLLQDEVRTGSLGGWLLRLGSRGDTRKGAYENYALHSALLLK